MKQGDNKRADFVLVRAKSDADLALAEARLAAAASTAHASREQVATLRSAVMNAQPPSVVPGSPAGIPQPAGPGASPPMNGGSK